MVGMKTVSIPIIVSASLIITIHALSMMNIILILFNK